jgi:hypothetical protein
MLVTKCQVIYYMTLHIYEAPNELHFQQIDDYYARNIGYWKKHMYKILKYIQPLHARCQDMDITCIDRLTNNSDRTRLSDSCHMSYLTSDGRVTLQLHINCSQTITD